MNNCSVEVVQMKSDLSETCHLFFSTLSNPTRLGILELLRESSGNVTQLAEALNQEQSMISHNLKPLVRCRFVFAVRKGKERVYSLNTETMEPLFKIFAYHSEKYCPTGGKCLTDRGLREQRKKDASSPLHFTHH